MDFRTFSVLAQQDVTSIVYQDRAWYLFRSRNCIGIAGRSVLPLRREIVSLRFMTVREARSKVLTRNFPEELRTQVTMGGHCDYNGLDRFYDDDHYRRDCYTVGNDVR